MKHVHLPGGAHVRYCCAAGGPVSPAVILGGVALLGAAGFAASKNSDAVNETMPSSNGVSPAQSAASSSTGNGAVSEVRPNALQTCSDCRKAVLHTH